MFIGKMSYSTYKRFYEDCKLIHNSYDKESKTCEVIIPNNKMMNCEMRKKRFFVYKFLGSDQNGNSIELSVEARGRNQAITKLLKICPGFTFDLS